MDNITLDMLTGRSDAHLSPLPGGHRLHPDAAAALKRMQQSARDAGINLQPASSFRDFYRQQHIWNGKFNGQKPVLDAQSCPIDISVMDEASRCQAILRWSALPGASRHHWGTDLDLYDPDALADGQRLQLEPWEYAPAGCFFALNEWLSKHMGEFGFYRPYDIDRGGIAVEPWHISYHPLAKKMQALLTPQSLLTSWQGEEIAGYAWLTQHLDEIFTRYINNINN